MTEYDPDSYDHAHAPSRKQEREDYVWDMKIKWIAMFFVWAFAFAVFWGLLNFEQAVMFSLACIMTVVTTIE